MQKTQNRQIATTRASIGEPPRLPEQPRAPSDGVVSKKVSSTADVRHFIEDNAVVILQKARTYCYGNTERAAEIFQELYPRMLVVLSHSAKGYIEYPWGCAHQILARLAIDAHRKERRRTSTIKRLEFPDSVPDKPLSLEDREDVQRLVTALDAMPDRERQILVGIFYEGCKAKDVAALLGLSESRLAELKKLALNKLRELLK